MHRREHRITNKRIFFLILIPVLAAVVLLSNSEKRAGAGSGAPAESVKAEDAGRGGDAGQDGEAGRDQKAEDSEAQEENNAAAAEGTPDSTEEAGGVTAAAAAEEYDPVKEIFFTCKKKADHQRSVPVQINAAILGGGEGTKCWAVFLPAEMADHPHLQFTAYENVTFEPLQEWERLGTGRLACGAGQDTDAQDSAAGSAGNNSAEDPLSESAPESFDAASAGARSYASGEEVEDLTNGSAFRVRMTASDGTEQTTDLYVFSCRDMPTMYLDLESGSTVAVDADKTKQTSEEAQFVVCRPDGKMDSSGRCRVRGRGNSTWGMMKKPYNLNLEEKQSILGIRECKKYCLLANTFDPTNLLDRISSQLAAGFEMRDTPEGEFVNLYLNGRYNGLYFLSQRPRTGGSVNIKKLDDKILEANGLLTEEDKAETMSLIGSTDDEESGDSDLTADQAAGSANATGTSDSRNEEQTAGQAAGSVNATDASGKKNEDQTAGQEAGSVNATGASGKKNKDQTAGQAPGSADAASASGKEADKGTGSGSAGRNESSGPAGKAEASGRTARKTSAQIPKKVALHEEGDSLKKWAYNWPNEPKNNTGGYLLQQYSGYSGDGCWFSTNHRRFRIMSPSCPTVGEVNYLSEYMLSAERAIYTQGGRDPETGKHYSSFLDLPSWEDMFLLEEFFAEWDAERWSFYIIKDKDDPLLYCGPAWDFDHSAGTMIYGTYPETAVSMLLFRDTRHGWLYKLLMHDEFVEDLHTRWRDRFSPAIHAYLDGQLEKEIAAIESAAYMNNIRRANDYDFREKTDALTTWLQRRLAFLDDYSSREDGKKGSDKYCRVEFQFKWGSLSHYVLRGQPLGYLPLPEFGETQIQSQIEKNEIIAWKDEEEKEIDPQILIDRDRVLTPVYRGQ